MFKLVDQVRIFHPTINVDRFEADGCFLYNFKEGGFSTELLTRWLDGKLMNIYEFKGRFGSISKCPWCNVPFEKECDLRRHKKFLADVNTIKLTTKAYPLLLQFLRNGNYDALFFLVHRHCQFCINPVVAGREGKCALKESSRNKPRSLKVLNLEFDGFNINEYSENAIAIIYKRVPNERSI